MSQAPWHKPECVSAPFCSCADERIASLTDALTRIANHDTEDCSTRGTAWACPGHMKSIARAALSAREGETTP